MRRLFCYTLSPHGRLAQRLAQVLYTHKAGGSNPSSPTTDLIGSQLWGPFLFQAHRRGIRTRKGAELRKRVSVFQRSTRGPQARSGSGRRSRTRHPSSPTTDLIGSQLWGPFLFQAHRRGIRTRKGAELRKRVSVFQRSTRGPQARSGSGRRSRTRTSLIAHHRFDRLPAMGAYLFWAQRMGFEPASTSVTKAVVKKRQI